MTYHTQTFSFPNLAVQPLTVLVLVMGYVPPPSGVEQGEHGVDIFLREESRLHVHRPGWRTKNDTIDMIYRHAQEIRWGKKKNCFWSAVVLY